MKLFKSNNMEIITYCEQQFSFDLPSVLWAKRVSAFNLKFDWIVQCFTSPPTQYRLYGRRFLQVKRPNQQYQSTEGDATKEKAKNENN